MIYMYIVHIFTLLYQVCKLKIHVSEPFLNLSVTFYEFVKVYSIVCSDLDH